MDALDRGDPHARVRLLPFLTHQNLQVRMNAAHDVLDIDREAALATFRAVAASKQLPQAASAAMALERRLGTKT